MFYPPGFPGLSYIVSNSADGLLISGTVSRSCPSCSDVPTLFKHTNVVAVLAPAATVRCSELEVCWNAASNRMYQVQYRSTLTSNAWANLGAPVAGTGTTNCVTDKIAPGEPQRFFRIVPLP